MRFKDNLAKSYIGALKGSAIPAENPESLSGVTCNYSSNKSLNLDNQLQLQKPRKNEKGELNVYANLHGAVEQFKTNITPISQFIPNGHSQR